MELEWPTKCQACGKEYVSQPEVENHLRRQPLCKKWIDLGETNDKLVKYINAQKEREDEHQLECEICQKTFSTNYNLNKHQRITSCINWIKYNEYQPIFKLNMPFDIIDNECLDIDDNVQKWEAPKFQICHIIWNIYLIDREYSLTQEILNETNIGYIISILPSEEIYEEKMKALELIDHFTMIYEGHTTEINFEVYDGQCQKIEETRNQNKSILIFCNNGYQRSIPFLVYYLTKYHSNEAPTIEKALDLILPQVDKENYLNVREKYLESMQTLLA